MPAPSLPLFEKVKILVLSTLLILAIYVIIDLVVPVKKWWAGDALSWAEFLAHIQLVKKLPIIIILSLLITWRNIKKRTEALALADAAAAPGTHRL